jgi:hypothetical protein
MVWEPIRKVAGPGTSSIWQITSGHWGISPGMRRELSLAGMAARL